MAKPQHPGNETFGLCMNLNLRKLCITKITFLIKPMDYTKKVTLLLWLLEQ